LNIERGNLFSIYNSQNTMQTTNSGLPIPSSRPSLFRVSAIAFAGLLVALAVALVFAAMRFNMALFPMPRDLQDLSLFLLVSGAVSVGLGAVGFLVGLGRRIPSLTVSMAVVYLIGAAVVGVNVWYAAFMMFLNKEHDLPLLTILLTFSAVISLFFAFFLSQSMVSRLRELLALSRRVADGDLSARVTVNSHDEIGRLGDEFNTMIQQLDQSRAQRDRLEASRRELIAAVSHDLRTPLASIRAMIEALNDGVVSDTETISHYLHTIQNETHHLTTLIDDLFELSQIDAGVLKLHFEPTSLADLLSDALESMAPQAERMKVRLHGQVEGTPPRVPLDAARMQRVLYNLIQNAIRHTPADGSIMLTVRGEPGRVELTVADTGEGIQETDLPHVFDRFYRGEAARTRTNRTAASGAGLGLAIAKGIVEAHGGTISAMSAPGEGATFRVVLPATS
jgi:signal transduction histidine kinase